MSTKESKYQGSICLFTKEKLLGKGGNGGVYLINEKIDGRDVVIKFFEYDGIDKEKRYKRFKNEINALKELNDIDGVMNYLDYSLPDEIPKNKDDAWYAMYKAKPYNVSYKKDLIFKIEEMLRLANILKKVHERGYSHRDIKPENILVMNGKIYLTDFGLVWNANSERITSGERLGPYKIMPPEFEEGNENLRIDYKLSDVYLFAKVLWMTLKNDNIGFRGQYDRKNHQIYLRRANYNVDTLEPIHQLIENATYDEIGKRITINQCIKLLELQKNVILKNVSYEVIKSLQNDEKYKEIINEVKPDEYSYDDEKKIDRIIDGIVKNNKICIKNSEENIKIPIENKFQIKKLKSKQYAISTFRNRRKEKEYIFNIDKITTKDNSKKLLITLESINNIDQGYVSIGESLNGLGIYKNIYLTENEHLVIECYL